MRYATKWTLKRSRVHFAFKVIGKWLTIQPNVMMNTGCHYIDSSAGGGKTLLMNWIIRNLLSTGGFFWTNINEFHHDRVKSFDLYKVWGSGLQHYKLDNKLPNSEIRCKGIVFDELNRFFNRRQNKQREYNDVFIPLVSSLATHRHDGYPRIYFIGQAVMLQDTQVMQLIKYRHYVTAKFRWRYYFFRNELKMVYAPYKLKIDHFKKIGINENGDPIWKQIAKSVVKIDPVYLETYDTTAFSQLTDDLPKYSERK